MRIMEQKKSIFSYIIWILFSTACGLEMGFCLLGYIPAGWGIPGLACAVIIWALLLSLVFLLLRRICGSLWEHISGSLKRETIFTIVLSGLFLSCAVFYLLLYLGNHIPIVLEDDAFYQAAYVAPGMQGMQFVAHGASWLYICVLHCLFLLFGNVPFAGIVLQMVFFFFCLLFLYIGLRPFTDTVSAVVSMAAFGFLPGLLTSVFSLTPELFYVTAYLLGFCLIGAFLGGFYREGISSPAEYLLFLLLGGYIGFLIYLDIFSVSLFFFIAVFCSLEDPAEGPGRECDEEGAVKDAEEASEKAAKTKEKRIRQAVLINLIVWAGAILGFSLCMAALFLTGRTNLETYFTEYLAAFSRSLHFLPWEYYPDTTLAGSAILLSLAFLTIPSFLAERKRQYSAFMLTLFLAVGLSVFATSAWDYQPVASLAWCMLAGVGVHGIFRAKKGNKEASVEETQTAEEGQTAEEVRSGEREQKEMEEMQKIDIVKKPAPGEPLHNPLPVPVKKKKQKIDFDHKIKEKDMQFDMEISENDDFDY